MDKVHAFLEMWQGSYNLHTIQKESHAQNKQKTAVGFMSDPKHMVNAWRSNSQHDCPTTFKLSEKSSFPPTLSAIHLLGGRTQQ
jgi:hypothetical protein